MADKSFGIRQLNLIGGSGTANITSPNNLNLNASIVAISTDVTVGRHLDVDGHAEFDAVNVAGVSTFAGITTVSGPSLFTNQLSISGVSTFLSAINVSSSYGTSGQVLTSQGSGSAPQWATPSGGKILQVQYAAHKTVTSTSCANNTTTVLTTFGVTITPSSTSSKIIVSMQLSGGWSADNPPHESVCSLSRRIGGTDYIFGEDDVSDYTAPSNRNLGLSPAQVALGNNDANLMSYIISNFQDSPSTTSAITYYPVVRQTVGSTQTFYHNRTGESNDDSNHERGTCWMIAMEVEG